MLKGAPKAPLQNGLAAGFATNKEGAIMKRYLWNLLIALDQLGNAVAAGDPHEPISSRAGKPSAQAGA